MNPLSTAKLDLFLQCSQKLGARCPREQIMRINAMPVEQLSDSDGFALTMLAMMFLSVGVIALTLICGLRNAARRNPHVDELLEDVAEEEKKKTPDPLVPEGRVKSEPWEREGDWWKK